MEIWAIDSGGNIASTDDEVTKALAVLAVLRVIFDDWLEDLFCINSEDVLAVELVETLTCVTTTEVEVVSAWAATYAPSPKVPAPPSAAPWSAAKSMGDQ